MNYTYGGNEILLKGSNLFKEICLGLIFAFMITRFVAPTIVVGNSMYPTLHNGNYLLINKIAYKLEKPKQNDIIVFKSNIKGHKILVKRIIAVPGDRIKILNGKVYINDKALDEPYLTTKQTTSGMIDITIPPEYFFVMGDNRADSIDSRFQEVGFVNFKDIIGKMLIKIF